MNSQDWSPLGLTGLLSLQFKGLSRVFSSTTVQKYQFFSAQSSLWSNSHLYMTIWTFVGKVISLLFNMLSRLVIAFLPRSKRLFNFMAAVTICSDFGSPQNKICHYFHCFSIYLPWSDGTRCHDLIFFECWVLSQLFHSPFTFIKRLFSSSSLCAIRVVSSAYLRLLRFFPAVLIPACASSSPAFHMMYSAYKLNK